MPIPVLFTAAALVQPIAAAPLDGESIVVTASRQPVAEEESVASATVIDRETLESLSLPMSSDLLRLAPGVSVSTSGPAGSQTDVRIRGAEADHTLIFVDGIRFNDPAAGNAPRFDLLTTDLLSRIEIVRGPQSALWGSEALGGVIAVESAETQVGPTFAGIAEYGSHESQRASGQFAVRTGLVSVSGGASSIQSDGIDAFGAGGERDGFENRSARLKLVLRPGNGELGLAGYYVEGTSEFDSYDPVTFLRGNTLDATDNRIYAVRGWGMVERGDWSLRLDGSYLDSRNDNRIGNVPLNSSTGSRFTMGAQLSRTAGPHEFTAAAEHQGEEFAVRDPSSFLPRDQDRAREVNAVVGQWRAEWTQRFVTDLAVRHDAFSAFRDATTVRAAALFHPTQAVTLHGAYGEGIAQPTFYDLYGYYPGSFAGNPGLLPETSKGWEAGLRWRSQTASLGITGFRTRLRNEIVTVFGAPSTSRNASGKSRRQGVEVDGQMVWRGVRISANYTYLDAEEQKLAGTGPAREARRPKHSANLIGSGSIGPVEWGAALAYFGKRRDTDFDSFPALPVTLGDYVLGSVKLGWRVAPTVELYGRVENLFDADYQDAFGYNMAGRTIYAGLRIRFDP